MWSTTDGWIAGSVFAGMSLVLCAPAERLRRARQAKRRAEKEMKRLHDALHAERQRLSLVLSNVGDEVYFTDMQGTERKRSEAALPPVADRP